MKKIRAKIALSTTSFSIIDLKEIKQEVCYPSAVWETEDGRFLISKIKTDGWYIGCLDMRGNEILMSNGLFDASFKTRREALEHLNLALNT